MWGLLSKQEVCSIVAHSDLLTWKFDTNTSRPLKCYAIFSEESSQLRIYDKVPADDCNLSDLFWFLLFAKIHFAGTSETLSKKEFSFNSLNSHPLSLSFSHPFALPFRLLPLCLSLFPSLTLSHLLPPALPLSRSPSRSPALSFPLSHSPSPGCRGEFDNICFTFIADGVAGSRFFG